MHPPTLAPADADRDAPLHPVLARLVTEAEARTLPPEPAPATPRPARPATDSAPAAAPRPVYRYD